MPKSPADIARDFFEIAICQTLTTPAGRRLDEAHRADLRNLLQNICANIAQVVVMEQEEAAEVAK